MDKQLCCPVPSTVIPVKASMGFVPERVRIANNGSDEKDFVILSHMENAIVNKVAESALTSIDLEEYYPKGETAVFDLKDHLFMGLILKEKDFRAALQTYDWEKFRGKYVAITCTADAIIPMWAYMLVASNLQPVAKAVVFGQEKDILNNLLLKNLAAIRGEDYTEKRVVVKGCGDVAIPEAAYVEITNILRPYVKSIMYGEPCSTVPIYKRK